MAISSLFGRSKLQQEVSSNSIRQEWMRASEHHKQWSRSGDTTSDGSSTAYIAKVPSSKVPPPLRLSFVIMLESQDNQTWTNHSCLALWKSSLIYPFRTNRLVLCLSSRILVTGSHRPRHHDSNLNFTDSHSAKKEIKSRNREKEDRPAAGAITPGVAPCAYRCHCWIHSRILAWPWGMPYSRMRCRTMMCWTNLRNSVYEKLGVLAMRCQKNFKKFGFEAQDTEWDGWVVAIECEYK